MNAALDFETHGARSKSVLQYIVLLTIALQLRFAISQISQKIFSRNIYIIKFSQYQVYSNVYTNTSFKNRTSPPPLPLSFL